MGAYDGYYLYCDLDGTLLDDDKRVSADNRNAICAFIEQGGKFGVATGRVPSIISAIEETLPVNAPCILANGAGLYDLSKKAFLATHPLDTALAAKLTSRVVQEKSDACVQVFTQSSIYEINPDQRDDPQTIIEGLPIIALPFAQIREPILKVLIAHVSAELDDIQAALQREPYFERLHVVRTSDYYLEIVRSGVNKGTALLDARERCGDVRKIFAIGDYNNDLEMVALADIGGAPANAVDAVKKVSDIVLSASNNESCVARFLKAALR